MEILVTSPIPSHPQNHGNRARVYTLCQELQKRGHRIHFLYSGFEGLNRDQEIAMHRTWDHVHILNERPKQKKPFWKRHYSIDDWHSDTITEKALDIISKWEIDACIANYVWCSKWLEFVPKGIKTYIDTHDVFTNRHQRLKSQGIEPNWFSTSQRQEARALKRADTILAIQKEEADFFSKITSSQVATIGHILPTKFQGQNGLDKNKNLKLGYIASDNPINRFSLKELARQLSETTDIGSKIELHLAGPICTTDAAHHIPNAIRHGFVENTSDFYGNLDIILNPHIGGTGLKIKSVEALSFGKPLIATKDAMLGLPVFHGAHSLQDMKSFADTIVQITDKPYLIPEITEAGRKSFLHYQKQQVDTLEHLFPTAIAATQ